MLQKKQNSIDDNDFLLKDTFSLLSAEVDLLDSSENKSFGNTQNAEDVIMPTEEESSSQFARYDTKDKISEGMTPNTLHVLRKIVSSTIQNLQQIDKLLSEYDFSTQSPSIHESISFGAPNTSEFLSPSSQTVASVLEGVFDGQNMVGQDGKEYHVPPNYASKSKLVEGDILKLSIDTQGNFVYKQIGPIERQRIVTTLDYDGLKKQYYAVQDDCRWKLLTASVTYYKGETGDEVVILVPRDSVTHWAAVENILKKYA